MSESKPDECRLISEMECERKPWFAYLLAVLWIFVPMLQYFGAYQRSNAVTVRDASIGALGIADLSPWYAALVGATALYVLTRAMSRPNMDRITDGQQE
jgi:hypothetical protein